MSERKMPSVEDYPSNATTAIQKKEEVKPVVKGKIRKRSSIFRSVKDEFISEDADSMGSYLLNDILFPALRDLINDICHGAIDAAFGGGGGSARTRLSSKITRQTSRKQRCHAKYLTCIQLTPVMPVVTNTCTP